MAWILTNCKVLSYSHVMMWFRAYMFQTGVSPILPANQALAFVQESCRLKRFLYIMKVCLGVCVSGRIWNARTFLSSISHPSQNLGFANFIFICFHPWTHCSMKRTLPKLGTSMDSRKLSASVLVSLSRPSTRTLYGNLGAPYLYTWPTRHFTDPSRIY